MVASARSQQTNAPAVDRDRPITTTPLPNVNVEDIGLANAKVRKMRSHLDEEWTDVWPVKRVFDHHVVHLPIRAGPPTYRNEPHPDSISNQELLKIPNFLHLTPKHIEKHIEALRPLCTRWPTNLSSDTRPLFFKTHTYLRAGASSLHPYSHVVELSFHADSIPLFREKRQKLLEIVKDRYDEKTEMITLKSDTLPSRKMNKDHLVYQLLAIYFELGKTEDWEKAAQIPVHEL